MGIADEEIVHYEGEGSGVDVVAEEHGGGSFRETVLGEEGERLDGVGTKDQIGGGQGQF